MATQTRLFVGNLPSVIKEDELKSEFSMYGDITCLDLKSKAEVEGESKKFAFITLSSTPDSIASCIKHFAHEEFKGTKVYVSIARESFLERLQREREQAQRPIEPESLTLQQPPKNIVLNLGEKLNPLKRKPVEGKKEAHNNKIQKPKDILKDSKTKQYNKEDKKKTDSDLKRMESLNKKREEFKQKKMIIKTGLVSIDKALNNKIIFSENGMKKTEEPITNGISKNAKKSGKNHKSANKLFDDDESDDEVDFKIKKQFEGAKGQKVLELQSRFKSDKRFVLDERFVDDDDDDLLDKDEKKDGSEEGEGYINPAEEKAKQLNILQDVHGVAIKTRSTNEKFAKENNKTKPKLGMPRFDPSQPKHAKYLAPVEELKAEIKKSKKKKNKDKDSEEIPAIVQEQKVEVSHEQFYSVSDTLKEAITKPNNFSLLSMFGKAEDTQNNDIQAQDTGYIPLEKLKDQKVKNPFDTGEKNPFKYDSSDSEPEDVQETIEDKTKQPDITELKSVWRETLFFSKNDDRLKDGLAFFNKTSDSQHKERRELKSLMKKRLYNKDRKDVMFKKKIGGKSKTKKKNFKRKK